MAVSRPSTPLWAEPPALRIRLLGDLALQLGDVPLPPIGSARVRSLLAYLLLHRDAALPRDRVAFLLWPDSTEAQARTNLRHLLHDLRRVLPEPERFLDVQSRTIRWRTDAPCALDVAEYERTLARAQHDGDDGLAALRQAVDAYGGDLLEGAYDDWVLRERDRLRQRQIGAVERLIALLDARGAHAEALARAEQLVRLDPLREHAYRLLMRLYEARGDHAGALRAFHRCATTLERELGTVPSARTREIYERLRVPNESALPAAPVVAMRRAPLVGRAREWTRLTDCWIAAEHGRAQMVLVTGEPGIGKTRLAEELRAWCARRGAAEAWARSYAAEGALAYAPVATWLRAAPVHERLTLLDATRRVEIARVLPELVPDAPSDSLPRTERLPDAEARQRLFDALATAVRAVPLPLLLVLDDVQWCDRETLQFVHYLLRTTPDARLLVVCTARREELDDAHPARELLAGLHALERVSELALDRLGRDDMAALSERLTASTVAAADVDRLFAHTAGNPLFVIETLRAGWEDGRLADLPLAPRVQAVIEARLARLGDVARELAGIAAVIGRDFTAGLLARVATSLGLDDGAVVGALDALWRRGIVRELGADAYDFSHDRIREVTYLALGPAKRRFLHGRVADALEALHARDVEIVTAQIAAHREHAGDADTAVRWYARAADVALARYANAEAVRLLGRALDLVRARPAGVERDAEELALLTRLVAPAAAVGGFAAGSVAVAQHRALALARSLGTEPEAPLLRSVAIASVAAGDFAAARAHAERLRARARRDRDDTALVESDYMLGIAAFWQGQLTEARTRFESVVARYRDAQRATHLLRYGLDPKVVCLSRLGNTLAFLGDADAAVRASDAALALAAEIDHPQSRSTTLVFACLLALELRDHERLRAHVAGLVAEGTRDDAPQVRIGVDGYGGFLDALDGRDDGIARVRAARDAMLDAPAAPGIGALVSRVLLEACRVRRDARAGLEAVARMRQAPAGSALWVAETERLRGEFLAMRHAPVAEVRAALDRALELARAQGAALFERRAQESARRLGVDR